MNDVGGYYFSYEFPYLAPPVPTSTEAGKVVWEKALDLAKRTPKADMRSLIFKAMEITGVSAVEMTAEDMRVIEMGLEAVLSQRQAALVPQGNNVRVPDASINPGEWSTTPGFFVR